MPKLIKKRIKSTSSSPYRRSPSLPASLVVNLANMKIKDEVLEKPSRNSRVTSEASDFSTTKTEKPEKSKRKPTNYWSKATTEEELDLLNAQFQLCRANVVLLRQNMTGTDRNTDQIHKKLNSFQKRFMKQCNGKIHH